MQLIINNKIFTDNSNEANENSAFVVSSVNERFKKVFPVLFGGGEARLILVESDDETKEPGIDIEAKPPGKKAQNVSLLSGGELIVSLTITTHRLIFIHRLTSN